MNKANEMMLLAEGYTPPDRMERKAEKQTKKVLRAIRRAAKRGEFSIDLDAKWDSKQEKECRRVVAKLRAMGFSITTHAIPETFFVWVFRIWTISWHRHFIITEGQHGDVRIR